MVTTPPVTPVTTPLAEPAVAMVVLLLAHVPPTAGSVNVTVLPVHTCDVPDMPGGGRFTVTIFVTIQPPTVVYDITAKPVFTPVTIPLDEPTVAMIRLLLAHVPPGVELLSVTDEPIHSVLEPVMPGGGAFTVTCLVALQPVPVE